MNGEKEIKGAKSDRSKNANWHRHISNEVEKKDSRAGKFFIFSFIPSDNSFLMSYTCSFVGTFEKMLKTAGKTRYTIFLIP